MAVVERLKKFVFSDKGRRILIAAAAAAMLLLLLSTASCGGKSSGGIDNGGAANEDLSEIERELERRLEQIISKIDGAGSVSVMITLEGSSELVYERDRKSGRNSNDSSESVGSETEVVLAGSSKEPLWIGTVLPKVRGAAIVCSGASDPVVRERVANVAAKVLDLGISRVYVTC